VQDRFGNKDEVIGGKLIVWSPDDQQQFPTSYGADGLLFTKDDPAGLSGGLFGGRSGSKSRLR